MSTDFPAEKGSGDTGDVIDHVPVHSDYAKGLETHVKRRYIEKISAIGIDPAAVPKEQFKANCLPPIEATDVLSYLVLETSYYTKQQFKAYKSLEAFNQMVSGFVTSVGGIVVAGKYAVSARVRHSQRMNDPLIPIWIICESDGSIMCAHCLGCKAGLAETCSHVASVMFYIEAWTRINGKLACTQVKCTWILPTEVDEVSYAKAADINFKSATKMKQELNAKIERLGQNTSLMPKSVSVNMGITNSVNTPTSDEMASLYGQLNKCSIKPVALSLIEDYSEQFISKSRSIPTITDLYDVQNMDLTYSELIKKCASVEINLSDKEREIIEKDTVEQAKGASFYRHRAGRIGASVSGSIFHTNLAQPSQSLIKSICYPHLFKVNSKAVCHGCKYEANAITEYEIQMKKHHINFKVKRCGMTIDSENQFIHATPDFITFCDCCGLGCGEVKCPYSIENGDFACYTEKKTACLKLDGNGLFRLKREHDYYFQVQQQMFVTGMKHCDFVVCAFNTSKKACIVQERIFPDEEHWAKVLPKLITFFRICILPEILGRWYTRKCMSSGVQQRPPPDSICFCRLKTHGTKIDCSNPECPYSQFHMACLGLDKNTVLPKTWYCPHCSRLQEFKKIRKYKSKSKQPSPTKQNALRHDSICICKSSPTSSESRLIMCHNGECQHGKYFHLSCLGYKKMPNNGKTTWKCKDCKNCVPTPRSVSAETTTCTSFQSKITSNVSISITPTCNSVSDSSSDSDSDIEFIKESVGKVSKHSGLASLQDTHYRLILDPTGWLDCDIIQRAHLLLHEINPCIQGLQRPTLGRVRNFDVVTGEFIQILHTGNDHWVCITSIGSLGGTVHLYDSLFSDVISQEVEEQTRDLLADNFVDIVYVPVQQQNNGSDCGVFSIATATSLVYGLNPQHITYDVPRMRPHLADYLKAGKLTVFPSL